MYESKQIADDLLEKSKKETDKILPFTALLIGKTGSGKSTLINSLFRDDVATTGVGKPVTQNLVKITKDGVPITLYDTRGLELSGSGQKEVINVISDLCQDDESKVDVAYYCLSAPMARIEDFEISLIKSLANYMPVILVLTQALGVGAKDFAASLEELNLPVAGIVSVLAKAIVLGEDQLIHPYGLDNLVEETLKVLPEEGHKAFINAQRIDLDLKEEKARSWAKRYVAGAFGVGFIPLPISDAAVLVPMQVSMLAHITAIFGLSLNKSQLVSIIAGAGGTGLTTWAGKYLAGSVSKMIPGLGNLAGGLVNGTTAASLTLALAYAYIKVLKQIALAEIEGRDLPLVKIQEMMNLSLKEQMEIVEKYLAKKE